jgi:hypothetical protein
MFLGPLSMHASIIFSEIHYFFFELTARDCASFIDREGSFTSQLTGFTETYSRAIRDAKCFAFAPAKTQMDDAS